MGGDDNQKTDAQTGDSSAAPGQKLDTDTSGEGSTPVKEQNSKQQNKKLLIGAGLLVAALLAVAFVLAFKDGDNADASNIKETQVNQQAEVSGDAGPSNDCGNSEVLLVDSCVAKDSAFAEFTAGDVEYFVFEGRIVQSTAQGDSSLLELNDEQVFYQSGWGVIVDQASDNLYAASFPAAGTGEGRYFNIHKINLTSGDSEVFHRYDLDFGSPNYTSDVGRTEPVVPIPVAELKDGSLLVSEVGCWNCGGGPTPAYWVLSKNEDPRRVALAADYRQSEGEWFSFARSIVSKNDDALYLLGTTSDSANDYGPVSPRQTIQS